MTVATSVGRVGLDRYSFYLVAVALAGWSLASYDVNLLVLALPAIAKDLNISQSGLGFLGLCVFGAQFCITLFAGYGMDTFGRRRMWMFCLAGSAIFTGLTYFVYEFWQLCLVRAVATGYSLPLRFSSGWGIWDGVSFFYWASSRWWLS